MHIKKTKKLDAVCSYELTLFNVVTRNNLSDSCCSLHTASLVHVFTKQCCAVNATEVTLPICIQFSFLLELVYAERALS